MGQSSLATHMATTTVASLLPSNQHGTTMQATAMNIQSIFSDSPPNMTDWQVYGSNGASSSRGSGVEVVFGVDQNANLLPYPMDLGVASRPGTIFLHIQELSAYREADIRMWLDQAGTAYPHARKTVQAYFFESLGEDHMVRLFKPSDPLVNSLIITLTMGASATMGQMPIFRIGNDHLPRYVPFAEWAPFHYEMDRDGVPLESFWVYKRFLAYPYIRADRQEVDTYIGDVHRRMQARPDHTHLAHLEPPPLLSGV